MSTTSAAPAVEQEPDRRQRRANPRVVRDAPVVERDVEVDADERAPAANLGRFDGARPLHYSRWTRSTSREL